MTEGSLGARGGFVLDAEMTVERKSRGQGFKLRDEEVRLDHAEERFITGMVLVVVISKNERHEDPGKDDATLVGVRGVILAI